MAIQELPPEECSAMRANDPSILHLDVRTPQEFAEGHPEGAYNVPIFFPGPGGMQPNPDFVRVVEKLAPDKSKRLVLSCAMGGRSMRGCHALEPAGYADLVNMVGGFNGYRAPDGTLVVPGWKDVELPVSRDATRGWDALKKA